MKTVKGITLIELLVAVAIVMIIAVIAFPSYQGMVEKSRRTEARAALSNIQLAQERFYTINGRFAANFNELSGNFADPTIGTYSNTSNTTLVTEQGFYNVTLPTATNTAFTVTATAVGAQAGDTTCSTLSISHLGVKTATNNTVCW